MIIEGHPKKLGSKFSDLLNSISQVGFQYNVVQDELHEGASEVMVYAVKAEQDSRE